RFFNLLGGQEPEAERDILFARKIKGAEAQPVVGNVARGLRVERGSAFRPTPKNVVAQRLAPLRLLALPPFAGNLRGGRQLRVGASNEGFVNGRIDRVGGQLVKNLELLGCETRVFAFGDVARIIFEPAVHPPISAQAKLGSVFVWSGRLQEDELVRGVVK